MTVAQFTCQHCGVLFLARKIGRNRWCPACRRLPEVHNSSRKPRDPIAVARSRAQRKRLRAAADAYPESVWAFLVRVGDDDDFTPAPATEPLAGYPGSHERVKALAGRVANGVELWDGQATSDLE